jgi:hypothetical protein
MIFATPNTHPSDPKNLTITADHIPWKALTFFL